MSALRGVCRDTRSRLDSRVSMARMELARAARRKRRESKEAESDEAEMRRVDDGTLCTTRQGPLLGSHLLAITALGTLLFVGAGRVASADDETAEGAPSRAERVFATSVLPVLERKCVPCHGTPGKRPRSDLAVTSREALLRGGASGEPSIVPGDAETSLLIHLIERRDPDGAMPPKPSDALSAEDIAAFRGWVDGGAPWPSPARVEAIRRAARSEEGAVRVRVPTSGGASSEWDRRGYDPASLWAYRPLSAPEPPDGGSPIDGFVDRRLRAVGLEAAGPASAREWVRRVAFDLTGLPPSPEDVASFVDDREPEAVEKLVDRLLASPRYGEQQARRWLDVARYADTSGFSNDFERPNAWRYRDWVVRSFAFDLPFDRFVRLQVAGDEIEPESVEARIAVGFLRMGPWEHTGMSVAKITRQQFLDDVTDSVGQTFLSHPLQCARCHDHKFDPIPTRDYYRLQAVFRTTQFSEPDAPFLEVERLGSTEGRDRLRERIAAAEEELRRIRDKSEAAAREWYAERGLEWTPREELLRRGEPEDRVAPRHIGLSAIDFGLERIARKSLVRHRWELDRYRPIAYSVHSGVSPPARAVSGRIRPPENPLEGGELERATVLVGGDPFSPGAEVSPGALSVVPWLLGTMPSAEEVERRSAFPDTPTGRRAALARWLTSAENPLTARSIANRVWHWRFGRGLVATPNNFGVLGSRPSHPELLDWLASQLVAEGWSLKRLHRSISLSAVYRRSTSHPDREAVRRLDPDGDTLAAFRPRRLEAEEIRDAQLAVSGELRLAVGGVPIHPEIHREVALQPRQIMGTYAPAYQPSPTPDERHRRTIWAVRIRGLRDPSLEVFNQPSSERSCEARESSTITPQVFALWNGRASWSRALAMASRLRRETRSDEELVERAFALCFSRAAEAEELAACLEHLRGARARHRDLTLEPDAPPTEVVRQAKEEMSGEEFAFTEALEVYRSWVPDLDLGSADPETRAIGDLCLVLLNTNELIFVH